MPLQLYTSRRYTITYFFDVFLKKIRPKYPYLQPHIPVSFHPLKSKATPCHHVRRLSTSVVPHIHRPIDPHACMCTGRWLDACACVRLRRGHTCGIDLHGPECSSGKASMNPSVEHSSRGLCSSAPPRSAPVRWQGSLRLSFSTMEAGMNRAFPPRSAMEEMGRG